MSGWLSDSTANRYRQSYIKEFLDVSGNVYVRNGDLDISGDLYIQNTNIMDLIGSGGGSIETGMILCWSGSADAVPSGWALCDGNNGTPDLSGKFVLGYGSSHSKAGTIGNNDEPKIVETTHLPPIVHADGNTNAPRVDHPSSSGITDYTLSYSNNSDGGMNAVSDNWIGLPADHGAASVNDQEPYYPPYYVLAYIMKTGDTSSSSGVVSHWTRSTNDLYYTTGNVGIGITDPSMELDLSGSMNISDNLYIQNTNIMDLIGSGGGGGSTTAASVVPVVTLVNASVYSYYNHTHDYTQSSATTLTNSATMGNLYWDAALQNSIDANSIIAHIVSQIESTPSINTIILKHYTSGGDEKDASLVRGTNWNVDFIENSAAVVTPVVTFIPSSTYNYENIGSGQTGSSTLLTSAASIANYQWDAANQNNIDFNSLTEYITTQLINNPSTHSVAIRHYNGTVEYDAFMVKGTNWTVEYQAFSGSGSSYWTQSTNGLYYNTSNVGIGITDPSMELDISGSTNISDNLYVTGNVGIGTTSPTGSLHIHDNSLPSIRLSRDDNNSNGFQIYSTSAASYISGKEDQPLYFETAAGTRMTVKSNGDVGIGITDPLFKLDVAGYVLAYHTTYGNAGVQVSGKEYHSSYAVTSYNPYTGYTTARFNSGVLATHFFAYSDSRIKTNIQEVNDSTALDKLRLLKPSLYNYIDVLARGENQVYGFLAQEVKEVLPDAVSQYPEFIPNIYSFGTYDASTNIITIENEDYDSASLSMDASNNLYKNARIYDASDNIIEICIEEIVGPKELKIKQDSEVNITSSIFLYGQEVGDFHKLNKDAIFTVATSALQEVDRQQQADKARIATLETENATLKTQMADVLLRLATLESA